MLALKVWDCLDQYCAIIWVKKESLVLVFPIFQDYKKI